MLNHDTCLALNVFLAKHKFVPEELVTWLMQGNIDSIGADILKLLMTLLPSDDEVHRFSSSLAFFTSVRKYCDWDACWFVIVC